MSNTPDPTDALRAALPPLALSRLQSLRLNDGVAIVVIEASGFDAVERERLGAVAQSERMVSFWIFGGSGVREK